MFNRDFAFNKCDRYQDASPASDLIVLLAGRSLKWCVVFSPAPLPDFAPIIINYRLLVRLGETGGSRFHHTHGETPPTCPYPRSGVDPPPNLNLCMYLTLPPLSTLALYLTLLTSTESRHILRQQPNQTRPTVNSKQNSKTK